VNEIFSPNFICENNCEEIKKPLNTKNKSTPVQPNLAKPGSHSGCPSLKIK
jgi:hypothetical protein